VIVDCDVIHADGGTRTAAISGGYVALALACQKLQEASMVSSSPLVRQVAAVSVGLLEATPLLDLDYLEDSQVEHRHQRGDVRRRRHHRGFREPRRREPFSENRARILIGLARGGIAEISRPNR